MRAPIRGAKTTVAFSSSSLDTISLEVSNLRSLCPELPTISIKATSYLSENLLNLNYYYFFKERCNITVFVFNPSPSLCHTHLGTG